MGRWFRRNRAEAQPATEPPSAVARQSPSGESAVAQATGPVPAPTRVAMIRSMQGWSTRFELDGEVLGGPADLLHDPRLHWHLAVIGGVAGKRILELGPLDGAHTVALSRAGATAVVAVEGFHPAWLRCLVTREVFELERVRLLFGDFCTYVTDYDGQPFDAVLAAGVLYHQRNPARLIADLARITDTVMVWSQVADEHFPLGPATSVHHNGIEYRGRASSCGTLRVDEPRYCGGVHDSAVWLYPDDLRRAFVDAGFGHIVERPMSPTQNGQCLLFVASKHQDLADHPFPLPISSCAGAECSRSLVRNAAASAR